jgi:hypothetical protein
MTKASGALAVLVFAGHAAVASAQAPPAPDPLLDMQAIAAGLGVRCEYCHVGRRGDPPPAVAPTSKPKQQIAREMIAMTRELNARVQAAAEKTATDAAPVTCITCHRGVPIPRQLSDIITRTVREKGAPEAVAQYRELRKDFYGRQSYDFGETELLGAAGRFVQARPEAAIALLELNVEFYPRSVQSYIAMARAYTRKLDDASAIKSLEKALEIEPENGVVRGQLAQLQSYQRNR